MRSAPTSASSSGRCRCSEAASRSRRLQELRDAGARRARRSSPSLVRKQCSRSAPTRTRRTAGSTGSARPCCGPSPTRRCRSASGGPATSRRRSTSRGAFANEGEDVAEVLAAHYLPGVPLAPRRLRTRPAPRRGDRRPASRRQRAAAVGAPQTAERAYRTADRPRRRRGGAHRPRRGGRARWRWSTAATRRRSSCSRMPRRGSRASAASGTALVSRPEIGQALPPRRSHRRGDRSHAPRPRRARGGHPGPGGRADQRRARNGPAIGGPGRTRRASPLERALELAQALELPSVLASASDLQGAAMRRSRPRRGGAHPVRRGDRLCRRMSWVTGCSSPSSTARFPAEIRPSGRRRAHQRLPHHREAHRQPVLRERRGVQPDACLGVRWRLGPRRGAWGRVARCRSRPTGRRVPSPGACPVGRRSGGRPDRARASRRDGLVAAERGNPAALDIRSVRGDDRARRRRPCRRARRGVRRDRRDDRDRRTVESGEPDRLSVRPRRGPRPRSLRRGCRPVVGAGRSAPGPHSAFPAGTTRAWPWSARRGRRRRSGAAEAQLGIAIERLASLAYPYWLALAGPTSPACCSTTGVRTKPDRPWRTRPRSGAAPGVAGSRTGRGTAGRLRSPPVADYPSDSSSARPIGHPPAGDRVVAPSRVVADSRLR